MSDPFWLTDEQMDRLRPFFLKSHGRLRVDDRRVLSGITVVNRNGLRGRDHVRPSLKLAKGCGPIRQPYPLSNLTVKLRAFRRRLFYMLEIARSGRKDVF
jgi:hypothetical protein